MPLGTSYSEGVAWAIIPQVLATGRYSHTEQGGVSGIVAVAGQKLDPEVQDKWETGVTANFTKYFVPTLTYFDTRVANDKTPTNYVTINGYSVAQWSESNTHRSGIELAAKGTLLEAGWPGKLSYTASWTRMTEIESSTNIYYQYTIPRDMFKVTLSEEWDRYFVNVSANYVSKFKSNFQITAPGVYNDVGNFTAIDVNFGRKFDVDGHESKLAFIGRNITNEKYETINGYQAIGAVYGVEFSIKY